MFEKYQDNCGDYYLMLGDVYDAINSGNYNDKNKIVLSLEEPNFCTPGHHVDTFNKVDKVLTSYFQISESEKKEKKQKINEGKKIAINSIKKLSETIEQELAAEFIVRENSNYKLVGKTNKSNLVFEHNGEQIRVTPKGEVL